MANKSKVDRVKEYDKAVEVGSNALAESRKDSLGFLTFNDADLTKLDFIKALKKCSRGMHPEIAMRSIGKYREYLFLLTCSSVSPESEEAKQLAILDSYYHQALGEAVENVYNHSLSDDGKTAISATRLMMEINNGLESKEKPIVVKDTGSKKAAKWVN